MGVTLLPDTKSEIIWAQLDNKLFWHESVSDLYLGIVYVSSLMSTCLSKREHSFIKTVTAKIIMVIAV